VVLVLNASMIVALVVAAIAANSISLLAAAGDTVGDCLGLVLGLIAIALRDRDPDHPHAQRPIALAALANSSLLLVMTLTVVAESVSRLAEGSPAVSGLPMVVASVITMIVMLAGAAVLGRSSAKEDIHMRSVLLDALADAAAAAGVAIGGAVILFSGGLFWVDPLLALVISAVVAVAAVRLGWKAIAALRGRSVDFEDD
jgi:cobalt-zinc-cadmium efflux system protein